MQWKCIAIVMLAIWIIDRGFALEEFKKAQNEKQPQGLEGTARFPCWSPDGNWIAFSLYGDIWKAPSVGGKAQRLTCHTAEDVKPRWSPNGQTIAFASNRGGNFDVWTIPAEGGVPKQITFHSVWDSISDWTPDGNWLIFYSLRSGELELWKISSEGGIALQITFDGGREGVVSNDGSSLVYCRGEASLWQKGYRGSCNWDIYQLSLKDREIPKKLTNSEVNEISPCYSADGKSIYYLREEDNVDKQGKKTPVYNLWKMNFNGDNPSQITNLESDMGSFHVSRDGKKMVFERDFGLWQMNLEDGKITSIPITIASDVGFNEQIVRTISEGNEMGHWSHNGQTMAFVLNGDIWTMPTTGGNARQITKGPAKDQWPRFSPDGKYLAYFSDKSGNNDIYILQMETSKEIQLTNHKNDDFFQSWSPDGNYIIFTSERSGNRDIWRVSSQGGIPDQLTDSPESEDDAVYSPDGKWIAFDSGKGGSQEIWIMPADKGYSAALQLTHTGLLAQVPTWSKDSQWLAYEINNNQGKASIWVVAREGGPSMQLVAEGSLPCWSADGKWILYEVENNNKKNLYCIEAPSHINLGKRIPFLAQLEVNLQEERNQAFEEAWQAISQGFYDPKFHDVDWQAVKEKYQPMVSKCQTDLELHILINRMSGELRASHTGVVGPEVKNRVETGYMGWKLEPFPGRKILQVTEVLREGPADQVWIRRGDFVFQIGEQIITREIDIDSLFNNQVGQKVKIFISPTLNPMDGRYVIVVPVNLQQIQNLKYRHWLQDRIELVREKCEGKVTYLHLTEMDAQNYNRFRQMVQKTIDRADGMILDIRNNGGGLIHNELLDILIRKPYVSYQSRTDQQRHFQPALYWDKPLVVLINEKSFSDAEVFAYAVKKLGLGYLVGTSTAGGVIGTRDITLCNEATFRVPRVGYYSVTGENLEGMGIKPDYLVPETTEDRLKNNDVQLLKACEVVMAEIVRRQQSSQKQEAPSKPEQVEKK